MSAPPTTNLTTAEVAARLRVSAGRVGDYIKDHGLPAMKVGRRWLIDPAALAAWERERNGGPIPASPIATDGDWLTEQLSKFTPDDLRRAAELFARLARDAEASTEAGAA